MQRDLPVEFMYELALREGNRKKPIYEIHKWWARRLGSCFRMLLLGATTPAARTEELADGAFYDKHEFDGLVVLDPFVGGGTSVIESLKCGASAIAVDVDPVACEVTRREVERVDERALTDAFLRVASACKERILRRYATQLPRGRRGMIINAFWVDVLACPECGSVRDGHPHYRLAYDADSRRQTVFCSHCGRIQEVELSWKTFSCSRCRKRTAIHEGPTLGGVFSCDQCGARSPLIDMAPGRLPPSRRLFALEVEVDGGKKRVFKEADERDRERYCRSTKEYRDRKGRLPVPNERIPEDGRNDRRPVSYGHRTYASLFNSRQLLCLGEIAAAIREERDARDRAFLALAFSDCLAANNVLCAYAFGYRRLTPLFGLHSYRRVVRPVENNVWGTTYGRGSFSKCFWKLVRGKRYLEKPYETRCDDGRTVRVYTGERVRAKVTTRFADFAKREDPSLLILNRSSEDLMVIPGGSVDLILTDPPYFDNLAYSELSDFYHVWLRKTLGTSYFGLGSKHTPMSESLFPDKGLGKEERIAQFRKRMRQVFKECRRVIGNEGLLVLTYHHRSIDAWKCLGVALLTNRFHVSNVLPVRSEGRSGFHSSDGNLKWDAVICARPARALPRRVRYPSPARAKTMASVKQWQKRLAKTGIHMSEADATSFGRAVLLRELSGVRWTEKQLVQAIEDADPACLVAQEYAKRQ